MRLAPTWPSATASPPAPAPPRASAGPIGWPPRCAARNADLAYRNLAVDGATSAAVLEQLPAALALEPDLVTVICGANDVLLSSRPDIEGYERRFSAILGGLRDGAARGGDPDRDRAGELALPRTAAAHEGAPGPGARPSSTRVTRAVAAAPPGAVPRRRRPPGPEPSARTSAPTACTRRRSGTSGPRRRSPSRCAPTSGSRARSPGGAV